ncbi:MAG: TM2 domain-containing protein [Bacteroidales bacterium]|nr:TM2 domain-containing protein [Bacteroidales bacterium]
MQQRNIDMFVMTNRENFTPADLLLVKEKLQQMDDEKFMLVQTIEFQKPIIMLIISIFLGYLGIDRFLLGDIGLGVAKLLTAGGCGIWQIIDWFSIQDRTKKKNYQKFVENTMF